MTEKFAYIVIYIIVFLFASSLGSFLNVIIYRLPKGISFVKGRSYCPICNNSLAFYDMVPVLSWIILKGKCRKCNNKISFRYPFVELLMGLLGLFAVYKFGFTINTIVVFYILFFLVAISFIDWDTMEIPNSLHLWLILPCIVSVIFFDDISIAQRVIGCFAISLPMFIVSNFVEGAFGGGDIKLMFVCGFILGWKLTLLAAFIGVLTCGIYAVYLLITKKAHTNQHCVFGPFLSFGIAISIFYGEYLIKLYLKLFFRY